MIDRALIEGLIREIEIRRDAGDAADVVVAYLRRQFGATYDRSGAVHRLLIAGVTATAAEGGAPLLEAWIAAARLLLRGPR